MENHDKKIKIIVMIGSIMLSIIVTLISAIKLTNNNDLETKLDSINLALALLLGCSTFIITELISLVVTSITYKKQQQEDEKFMDNITEYSQMLHSINRYYYEISQCSHGDNDLFVTYARKEIEKLHSILFSAARQKEFNISSDYIINASGVFDSFSQTNEKILKMTFPIMCSDDELFTTQADLHFFEVLNEKVLKKEVQSVKVIVILEEKKLEKSSYVSKLLDFFSATKNFSCRITIKKDFEAICETNGVSSQYIDFGIYGPKMLYVAEQYYPSHKGTYYKDETKVKLYNSLFNEVWASDTITYPNPSKHTNKVEIATLLKGSKYE